ncbi:hypothetical protein L5F25_03150 [Aliarcobacter butzleri]|uniref:hypothetical protein n=1 Tax=Aliarcobacter butzleri TaxID=28197 RepID=UPI001EDB5DF5|nr:hypothetical protein [Aliarcobacter butzleri]MCG3707996.1 hypothetical protein [Aliarcobacter butzleri]
MQILTKYLILLIIIFIGLFIEQIFNFYKTIVFDGNTITLLVSLISGLFGFTVAVIPFAIQLFNQDNTNKKNDFLNKLMKKDKFDYFIKPMFNRFIKMLYIMFCLFAYAILLTILETNKENLKSFSFLHKIFFEVHFYKYLIAILFYFYIVLIIEFFIMLRNIIRDLQTLVFNFFKSKESELKKLEENKND